MKTCCASKQEKKSCDRVESEDEEFYIQTSKGAMGVAGEGRSYWEQSTTFSQLVGVAKELFFPDGTSSNHGAITNYKLQLGRFDECPLEPTSFGTLRTYMVKYRFVHPINHLHPDYVSGIDCKIFNHTS